MKEIANSSVALPGVSDGGAHTKFVTTARYPTELHQLLGARTRDHVAGGGALAAVVLPGHGGRPEGPWRFCARVLPPTSSSTTTSGWTAALRSGCGTTPAGEMRLVQKATGYERIIVNGVTTFIDGECTDASAGTPPSSRHGLRSGRHGELR